MNTTISHLQLSHPPRISMNTTTQPLAESSPGIRHSSFDIRYCLILLIACLMGVIQAQTVPLFMNYQGRVTDSTGTGLGTGTPVNRKVVFRIWDTASSGGAALSTPNPSVNRLWTEEQTVTISNGEFSVLLGQGIAATGGIAGESRPALDTVFTSSGTSRYLEVIVDNGDGAINASDTPISPRQQLTSTAYSFRARSADTVASGTDLTLNNSANYGLGYYGGARTFNSTDVNGPVLYGQGGGVLGVVNGATQTSVLRWNATGQVGIGSSTLSGMDTTSKLLLQGDDGTAPPKQLTIRGSTDTTKRLLIGYNTTGNYGAIQGYNAVATPTNLVLNQIGGDVGIGNASPTAKLDVTGGIRASGTGGHTFNTGDLDGGLFSPADGVITLNTNNQEKVRVDGNGNVGIGTASPSFKLDISTPAGTEAKIRLGDASATVSRFIGIDVTAGNAFSGIEFGGPLSANEGYLAFHTHDHGVAANEKMRIDKSGNVGIGTISPTRKLSVESDGYGISHKNGTKELGTYIDSNTGNPCLIGTVSNHTLGFFTNNSSARMSIDANGNVGIATSPNGSRAKLTVGNVSTTTGINTPFPVGRYMDNTSTGSMSMTWGGGSVSIEALSNIVCNGVFATSDERIKKVLGQSDGVADLKTLLGIKVTDYLFKDQIANGGQRQKKVIAQQVETIFPQAVSQGTNTVPDIFKKAAIEADWIMLTTDLKKGDRVKLIDDKDVEAIQEVLEVKKDKFRTDFKTEAKEVFVYGREVNDFRRVDYEAISMLNVSATQQIKKEKDAEVKALKDENSSLKDQLAAQAKHLAELQAKDKARDAADKARDAKLAAIEKALLSDDKPTVRTASLKKAE